LSPPEADWVFPLADQPTRQPFFSCQRNPTKWLKIEPSSNRLFDDIRNSDFFDIKSVVLYKKQQKDLTPSP
jgi:hypothetical protein